MQTSLQKMSITFSLIFIFAVVTLTSRQADGYKIKKKHSDDIPLKCVYSDKEILCEVKSSSESSSSSSESKISGSEECEDPYETFDDCANPNCEHTCEDLQKSLDCSEEMCVPGCVCIPPLVRDVYTNECIDPIYCDKQSSSNEYYALWRPASGIVL